MLSFLDIPFALVHIMPTFKSILAKCALLLFFLGLSNCIAITSDTQHAARTERIKASFASLVATHSPDPAEGSTVSYDLSPSESAAAAALEQQMIELGILDDDRLEGAANQFVQVLYSRRQTPEDIDAEIAAWDSGQPDPVMSATEKELRIEEEMQTMAEFYEVANTSVPDLDVRSLQNFRLNLATAILSYDYLKEKLAAQPDVPPELVEKNLESLIQLRRLVIDEQHRRGF